MEDYETAPIDEKLRATLGFLRRVTLTPDDVTGEHASAVLATGVSHAALVDALYVAFIFNTMDRLADTLGWEVPSVASFRRTGKMLLKRGYK